MPPAQLHSTAQLCIKDSEDSLATSKMKLESEAEKKLDTECGFLKCHHSNLRNSISDEQLQELSTLQTNENRFAFVYKLPVVHEYEIKASISGKNTTEAEQLKQEGNRAFQNGNYQTAMQSYTKSILKTPWSKDSTQQLAIAVANRSATFYHMEKYELALQDIELVLSLDYPSELHYKVLDRKARCLLATKQLKDALEAFRCTLTALDSANLPVERKHKWQMDVQIMLTMLAKNKVLANVHRMLPKDADLPSVTGQRNSRYVSASSAVTIEQSKDMGRFAVAGKDVKVGDTLVVEPAFVAVLLAEHADTHCFHCFRRLEAAVPCNQCSRVAFCSVVCQKEALTTHHVFECPVLETLWSSGASIICLMALRMLSQRGLNYFLDIKDILKMDCDVVNSTQKYHPTDYRTVYNLVSHSGTRTVHDFLFRTDTAILLFRCLKVAGFFNTQTTQSEHELTPDEVFVGGLLLHHLQLLQFNAHEISELQLETPRKLNSARSVFLGGGLYPTLALFNHSCDPGITRYFQGTSVIVCAIKNICCGEMIAENYGQIFTQTPRAERQAALKSQYWFDCVCVPCNEDWPMFNNMHQGIMRFRCETGSEGGEVPKCNKVIIVPTDTSDFMIQCPVCKQYTNILKGLKVLQNTDSMFQTATQLMEEGKMRQALDKYIEILVLLDSILAPPFKDFHLCQQAIRRCMLSFGNKSTVSEKVTK